MLARLVIAAAAAAAGLIAYQAGLGPIGAAVARTAVRELNR